MLCICLKCNDSVYIYRDLRKSPQEKIRKQKFGDYYACLCLHLSIIPYSDLDKPFRMCRWSSIQFHNFSICSLSSNFFGYLLLAIMRVFTSNMVTEAQYCKCWLLSQWLNTGDQWTASDLQMCLFSLLTSPPSPSLFIASHSCLGHIPLSLQYLITLCSALWMGWNISSVQFSHSVISDSLRPHELQHARPPCPTPTPGAKQTHVHWVGDAIQPSHPLLSPSPPALNLSQHQSLFKWVSSSRKLAKVLEFQLQHQSFQLTPRTDFL